MKITRVLCAVNNDPLAESVFDLSFELAQKLGAEFSLVSILDKSLLQGGACDVSAETLRLSLKSEIDQLFSRLLKERQSPNVFKFCEEGNPKHSIVDVANTWRADLIVIASHGRSGLSRALMGSVAESVLRNAKCPVLIIPAQK